MSVAHLYCNIHVPHVIYVTNNCNMHAHTLLNGCVYDMHIYTHTHGDLRGSVNGVIYTYSLVECVSCVGKWCLLHILTISHTQQWRCMQLVGTHGQAHSAHACTTHHARACPCLTVCSSRSVTNAPSASRTRRVTPSPHLIVRTDGSCSCMPDIT